MMQHTEKRGLSIIERDDAFSPEALNDNTRKIEAALDEHEEKVDGQVADLDARVKVFEAKKLAFGTCFVDQQKATSVELGFTLIAVFVSKTTGDGVTGIAVTDNPCNPLACIVEDGFETNVGRNYTYDTGLYNFIAFG